MYLYTNACTYWSISPTHKWSAHGPGSDCRCLASMHVWPPTCLQQRRETLVGDDISFKILVPRRKHSSRLSAGAIAAVDPNVLAGWRHCQLAGSIPLRDTATQQAPETARQTNGPRHTMSTPPARLSQGTTPNNARPTGPYRPCGTIQTPRHSASPDVQALPTKEQH